MTDKEKLQSQLDSLDRYITMLRTACDGVLEEVGANPEMPYAMIPDIVKAYGEKEYARGYADALMGDKK